MHYTECTECCLIYNKLGVVGTRQCVLWRSRFSCSCIRYSLDFRLTNCLRTHNNIHQCANTDKLIQQAVVRGTTNPPPHAATQPKAKSSNFITFSVARWQHRTARRPQSNQIATTGDNKLTLDPPTRLPELTQNLIRSSHGHSTSSLKISCKSVQQFSRNVADKETKKQRNKERKKSPENNTPSPYRGRGNNIQPNAQ